MLTAHYQPAPPVPVAALIFAPQPYPTERDMIAATDMVSRLSDHMWRTELRSTIKELLHCDALAIAHLCVGLMHSAGRVDLVSINLVMSAYKRHGQLNHVLLIRDQILLAGLGLDTVSYNIVIDACGKGGQLNYAFACYHEMKGRGCEPTVSTYTCLIDACGKNAELDLAESLLDQMALEAIRPNACTYTSLIQACCASNALTRGVRMLHRMVDVAKIVGSDGETLIVSYDKAFECDKPFTAVIRAGLAAAQSESYGPSGMDVTLEALSLQVMMQVPLNSGIFRLVCDSCLNANRADLLLGAWSLVVCQQQHLKEQHARQLTQRSFLVGGGPGGGGGFGGGARYLHHNNHQHYHHQPAEQSQQQRPHTPQKLHTSQKGMVEAFLHVLDAVSAKGDLSTCAELVGVGLACEWRLKPPAALCVRLLELAGSGTTEKKGGLCTGGGGLAAFADSAAVARVFGTMVPAVAQWLHAHYLAVSNGAWSAGALQRVAPGAEPAFATLLRACVAHGRPELSFGVLYWMLLAGIVPTSSHYVTLLGACNGVGVLSHMQANFVAPPTADAASVSAFLHACVEVRAFSCAEDLLQCLVQLNEGMSGGGVDGGAGGGGEQLSGSAVLEHTTAMALLHACTACGDDEAHARVASTLSELGVTLYSPSSVMDWQQQWGGAAAVAAAAAAAKSASPPKPAGASPPKAATPAAVPVWFDAAVGSPASSSAVGSERARQSPVTPPSVQAPPSSSSSSPLSSVGAVTEEAEEEEDLSEEWDVLGERDPRAEVDMLFKDEEAEEAEEAQKEAAEEDGLDAYRQLDLLALCDVEVPHVRIERTEGDEGEGSSRSGTAEPATESSSNESSGNNSSGNTSSASSPPKPDPIDVTAWGVEPPSADDEKKVEGEGSWWSEA